MKEPQYTAVRRNKLYERIVQQFEMQILGGVLRPGDRLPTEGELGKRFEVSRTTIREAVSVLRDKGMVEIHPRRGTFVTDQTRQAASDSLGRLLQMQGGGPDHSQLLEVRELIEPSIAGLAARRAKPEHVARLQDSLVTMTRSVEAEDAESFIEVDVGFHVTLAEATGNVIMPQLLHSVVHLFREVSSKFFFLRIGRTQALDAHRSIIRAIEGGDAVAASEGMRAHLLHVAGNYRAAATEIARREMPSPG